MIGIVDMMGGFGNHLSIWNRDVPQRTGPKSLYICKR